eukprot:121066-Chlamydomonas_euryale.AAC.2
MEVVCVCTRLHAACNSVAGLSRRPGTGHATLAYTCVASVAGCHHVERLQIDALWPSTHSALGAPTSQANIDKWLAAADALDEAAKPWLPHSAAGFDDTVCACMHVCVCAHARVTTVRAVGMLLCHARLHQGT